MTFVQIAARFAVYGGGWLFTCILLSAFTIGASGDDPEGGAAVGFVMGTIIWLILLGTIYW